MTNNVCSYKLAIKLEELGYHQRYFYDFAYIKQGTVSHFDLIKDHGGYICEAPTAGELMDILPSDINIKSVRYDLSTDKYDTGQGIAYCVYYINKHRQSFVRKSDFGFEDALAKMLIRCIEEGHLSLKD